MYVYAVTSRAVCRQRIRKIELGPRLSHDRFSSPLLVLAPTSAGVHHGLLSQMPSLVVFVVLKAWWFVHSYEVNVDHVVKTCSIQMSRVPYLDTVGRRTLTKKIDRQRR